jgi:thiosulfate dehydrogenase [quinone] large subunit
MKIAELEKAWAVFVLRVCLGLLFCNAGLNKFLNGVEGTRSSITEAFSGTWLPAFSVDIFATILPYWELGVGILIILGLFRFWSLALGSVLMLSLAFGMMVKGDGDTMFKNIVYVALFVLPLFAGSWDRFNVDALIWRKPSSGS